MTIFLSRFLLYAALGAAMSGCSDKPADFYSGYVEADYVRLSSPVGGTLARLYVARGDTLARGASAFVQDSERAARQEVQSRLQRAQAFFANLKKGKRPDELAIVQAQLGQAHSALALSQAELERETALSAARFVSPARLDQARTELERNQAHVRELQAQLRVAKLEQIVAGGFVVLAIVLALVVYLIAQM